LTERIQALNDQYAELEALRQKLLGRGHQFQLTKAKVLAQQMQQARAAIRAAKISSQERDLNLQRYQSLFQRGFVSAAMIDQAYTSAQEAKKQLEQLRHQLDDLSARLTANRKGIFVTDSQNDVAYSTQRIDEIELRQQDLRARRREHEIRVAEIDRQIAIEQARLEHQRHFVYRAPFSGIVWQTSVTRDSDVMVGGELLQLANCEDIFLEVVVDESYSKAIYSGQRTAIRLLGSDETVTGFVRNIRGGAVAAKDNLRVSDVYQVNNRGKHEIAVTIGLPEHVIREQKSAFCQLGRSARVFFPR
jgi:multidrug resistance efflux pump